MILWSGCIYNPIVIVITSEKPLVLLECLRPAAAVVYSDWLGPVRSCPRRPVPTRR
jgi:hypothetical protein